MTKVKRALLPARGVGRWLARPNGLGEGGVLAINDTPYLLSPVRLSRREGRKVVGWKLTKADGTVYDLHPGEPHWTCDCGSFVFERDMAPTPELRECKHIRALKAALAALWQTRRGDDEGDVLSGKG